MSNRKWGSMHNTHAWTLSLWNPQVMKFVRCCDDCIGEHHRIQHLADLNPDFPHACQWQPLHPTPLLRISPHLTIRRFGSAISACLCLLLPPPLSDNGHTLSWLSIFFWNARARPYIGYFWLDNSASTTEIWFLCYVDQSSILLDGRPFRGEKVNIQTIKWCTKINDSIRKSSSSQRATELTEGLEKPTLHSSGSSGNLARVCMSPLNPGPFFRIIGLKSRQWPI